MSRDFATAVASGRPLVTVAIPTYNRASNYLRVALESALAQTYEPLEIVVADNCSTDGTEATVRSYRDSRVRYFRQLTPIPPNDNFNFCLKQARGRYFLMLHDDDAVDPDFVARCLATVHYRDDAGLIRTGTRIIDGQGTVISEIPNQARGLSTREFFLAWFTGRTALYLCSTLYNTEKLREIGGFHSRHNLFQDGMASIAMAARFGRVDVPDIKASFRVHAGELTRAAKVQQWCEDSRDLLELMCSLATDNEQEIRAEGTRFFTNVNYSRASKIEAARERIGAFVLVFRFFGYRVLPSWRLVVGGTAAYRALRHAKRRLLGLPEWAG